MEQVEKMTIKEGLWLHRGGLKPHPSSLWGQFLTAPIRPVGAAF